MEAAKAKVEQASAAITDGYAAEDQSAVARARKTGEPAAAEIRDLQHRVDGAALRVQRAQQQLDEFAHQHARDLLAERESNERTVAAELTASVHHTLRLAKAYVAERQAQDQLVAAVSGATPHFASTNANEVLARLRGQHSGSLPKPRNVPRYP